MSARSIVARREAMAGGAYTTPVMAIPSLGCHMFRVRHDFNGDAVRSRATSSPTAVESHIFPSGVTRPA